MRFTDIAKDDVTKADGSYALRGLSVGDGWVRVSAKGYAEAEIGDLRLEEKASVERDFVLFPTGTVTGRIVGADGRPLAGVRIMAKRARTRSGLQATIDRALTDADGRYKLLHVAPGEGTTLVAKRPDLLSGQSGVFSVAPGEALELPDIALRQGGTVRGTVLGPGGEPVPRCLVMILYEGDKERQEQINPYGSTTVGGEYVVEGLRTGAVRVVVKPENFLEKAVGAVQVQEGSTTRVDVRLERGNSVAGRVLDAGGKPIDGAEVLVRDFSRGVKELRALSDAEGKFAVEGIAAKDFVELAVSHKGHAAFTERKVAVGRNDLEVVLKAE